MVDASVSRGDRSLGDLEANQENARLRPSGGHGGSFARFSARIATLTGRPATFALACATIVLWGVSGPIFRWSDTWQLVINTGTTIVTFLMVFVIQNAQNRDAMAIQVKLDELICATKDAREKLIGIEDMDDSVVERLKMEIHSRTQAQAAAGRQSPAQSPARAGEE